MRVVGGLDAIEAASSPAFVVVGVFDGLHRGHAYLLEHLVAEAGRRGARPVVVTFDHHPDEVLTGSAPPILCDPDERIERLEAAGVETTVIVHFDRALRETPYDAFVGRLAARTPLDGFLMTPDAAFGYQRAGTPAALAELGAARGFEVVVVPRVRGGRARRQQHADPVGDRRGRPRVGGRACSAGRTRWWGRQRGRARGACSGSRSPSPCLRKPDTGSASGRVHPVPWPRRRPTSRTRSSGSRATAGRAAPGWRSSTSPDREPRGL